MAGLGPMNVASSAPAKSASTASGPALNVCVSSRDLLAEAAFEDAGADADGSVGDVEVAEAEGDRVAGAGVVTAACGEGHQCGEDDGDGGLGGVPWRLNLTYSIYFYKMLSRWVP